MTITIDETSSVYSLTGTALTQSSSETLNVTTRGHIISAAGHGLALGGIAQLYNVSIAGNVSAFAEHLTGLSVGGTDTTANVTVERGGTLHGHGQGIHVGNGGTANITNNGAISSTSTLGYGAITFGSTSAGGYVMNSGYIHSASGNGILIAGAAAVDITNYGTIIGGTARAAIEASAGTDGMVLFQNGAIWGDVNLGSGADHVLNVNGRIIGNVTLGAGNDTYSGSVYQDYVWGGDDADELNGYFDNDSLYGQGGADRLDGGAGWDNLTGGDGGDMYFVDDAHDQVFEDASGTGTDTIVTSASYVLQTGSYVEVLKAGAFDSVSATNLTGNAQLGQLLYGNHGVNVLDGGTDSFADTMTGYNGNDTYLVRSVNDGVIEAAGGGTADHVRAAVSFTLQTADDIEILETLAATATTAINLTGNNLGQAITGNAGANRLSGLGGNDVISGGLGNDTLTGGLNNDTFVFNTVLNTATNRDSITDYSSPNDVIHLENSIAGTFTSLAGGVLNAAAFKANAAGTATDLDDRIVYNTATGVLTYDSNGSAAGGAVQFAVLTTRPAITHADFFVV